MPPRLWMTEPLVVEFEVHMPIAHAFGMWTARCSLFFDAAQATDVEVISPNPAGRLRSG